MAIDRGLLAILEAKAGKGEELAAFLQQARELAVAEEGTVTWYAFKLGETTFGIFDTFKDETGRNAHLSGDIAKALFAKADELLSSPPQVEKLEILASKAPAA